VTWLDVEGACEDIKEFVATPLIQVLSTPRRCTRKSATVEPQCPADCAAGFSSFLLELFFAVFGPGSSKETYGYLWKLNNTADCNSKEALADLKNWRRRIYVHRTNRRERVLAYISEKDDGSDKVACVLRNTRRKFGSVAVQAGPIVQLRELGRAERRRIVEDIQTYDTAFADLVGLRVPSSAEECEEDVPRRLYPLTFSWDYGGAKKSFVVAATSQESRREWLRGITLR